MIKIPTIFLRDSKGNLTRGINPAADFVFMGEGVPTRKWDGQAAMIRGNKLFKRYDNKKGRTPPQGFEPCQEPDPITGHHPGWVPCILDNPSDSQFTIAFINICLLYTSPSPRDGLLSRMPSSA